MKKCKQGYYYCYKDKKCKRIPGGYRVGLGGYLRREKEEEKSEDSGETETKKNGNGNGNGGNGGNGNGGNGGGNGGGGVSESVMTKAQIKKRDEIADSMSTREFNKRYGKDRGKSVKYATATKLAMKEGWSDKYKKSIDCDNPKGFSQKAHCQGKKKMNEQTCPVCGFDPCQCLEGVITEKRDGKSAKDKGYSLRDWFKGGGWKQTGGKYDGKPCAKQPGQKTKPYCRDADDRAAMSKEERNKRAAKKRKEDPNPNRRGKARNVTQESYSNWKKDFEVSEQSGYGVIRAAGQTIRIGTPPGRPSMPVRTSIPSPSMSRPVSRPMTGGSTTSSTPITSANNTRLRQAQQDARDVGRMTGTSGLMNKTIDTANRTQSRYDMLRQVMRQAGMKGADQNMNMRGVMMKNSYQPEGEVVEGYDDGDVIRPTDRIRMKDGKLRTLKDIDAKLDKKTKKEEVELVGEGDMPTVKAPKKTVPMPTVKGSKTVKMPDHSVKIDEGKKDACYHKVKSRYSVWPSAYASGALVKCRKVGAKNWGNKSKKNESVDYSNWRDDFIPTEYETTDLIKADPIQVPPSNLQKIEEAKKCWKGYKKTGTQKLFGKTYNRCEKIKKEHYDWRAELEEGAAWTKKEGKNKSGGLNEKGRKSYERENPGSDLKRPSKKVGNKRRASFCARMKGMKKKLTSKKTANDPNSRINKSLRAWNC